MPFGQTILVENFETKHMLYIFGFILAICFITYTIYSLKNFTSSGQVNNIVKDYKSLNIQEFESYDQDQCNIKYKDKRLHDFYIASSANSFLVGNQKYDNVSLDMIKNCIIMGARYVELEIMCDSLDINPKPIVTTGTELGQWQTSLNNIDFEEVCQTIATYAFSPDIKTHQLPFFLYIKLKTNNNPGVLGKMGRVIKQYFPFKKNKEQELGNLFPITINPAQVPMCTLFNQIVIWSDPVDTTNFDNIQMDLVNNYIEIMNKYTPKRLHYTEISEQGKDTSEDARTPEQKRKKLDDLTETNKTSLSIVYPNKEEDSKSDSYNPEEAWSYGCQFVAINYQLNDDNRTLYFQKFINDSFILKPEPLTKPKEKLNLANLDMMITDEAPNKDIILKRQWFFNKDKPVYFRPFNDSSKVLTIDNYKLVIKTKTDDELTIDDAFLIKPYLGNVEHPSKISLESVRYPNYYLVIFEDGFELNDWRTRKFDSDAASFITDASFILKQGVITTRGNAGSEEISSLISLCIQGTTKKIVIYHSPSQTITFNDDDNQNYDLSATATFNIYKLPVETAYNIRQSDNQYVQTENTLLVKKTSIGLNGFFIFVNESDINVPGIDKNVPFKIIHIKDNKNNYWSLGDKSLLRSNATTASEKTRFYLKESSKFTKIFYKNPKKSEPDLPVIAQSDGVLRLAYPNEIGKKETNFIISSTFTKKKK
jgi:hypothetical protein